MNPKSDHSPDEGEVLFAAANSGRGFFSFYSQVFGRKEIERRYIIKGGPGTGKSSLMKKVAAYASERGHAVCSYRCSSDPDSLDGVVLDGKIALLDGTAPHAMDAEWPGVRDELINLGEFWDGEALTKHYGEIVSLSEGKKTQYARAYRYLSAATELEELNGEQMLPFLKREKMGKAVSRLMRDFPNGDGFDVLPGLRRSIGMRGRVALDTYERKADRLFAVADCYGLGHWFLRLVVDAAAAKQCPLRVSYHPLLPSHPDGVRFLNSGRCLVLDSDAGERADVQIRMSRFVEADIPKEIKNRYRWNRRMSEALIGSAEEALAEAGKLHFELEKIYASCMDFEAQNRFVRSFCRKIVS